MSDLNELKRLIFEPEVEGRFEDLAMRIFYYQSTENPIYRKYLNLLGKDPANIHSLEDVPFLPVQLFRTHRVISGRCNPQLAFSSSGTTGQVPGVHFVCDPKVYERSFLQGFRLMYGDPQDWCILALLSSYIERPDSSLIYMVDRLIAESSDPHSGFYLDDPANLPGLLRALQQSRKKVLIIGVSFALLDFAEQFPGNYSGITFMETGGMKGRRRELTRTELHQKLCNFLQVETIHSEYGMTELLSQGYSTSKGLFQAPPWMKVLIREVDDPLSRPAIGRSGGIDIIDLANIDSCSFLSVQDLGRLHPDGRFEVLGRFDHSEARGCNLMLSD